MPSFHGSASEYIWTQGYIGGLDEISAPQRLDSADGKA